MYRIESTKETSVNSSHVVSGDNAIIRLLGFGARASTLFAYSFTFADLVFYAPFIGVHPSNRRERMNNNNTCSHQGFYLPCILYLFEFVCRDMLNYINIELY